MRPSRHQSNPDGGADSDQGHVAVVPFPDPGFGQSGAVTSLSTALGNLVGLLELTDPL